MNKKLLFIALIIFLLFFGIFIGYLMDNNGNFNERDIKLNNNSNEKVEIVVSSEGPLNITNIIKDIKTNSYFEGYNENTLKWMESLDQKEVFVSNNSYVIMNEVDAGKINTEFITDAYIDEYIDCVVIENRSLGGKNPKDILLVKDVTYIRNETHYFEV